MPMADSFSLIKFDIAVIIDPLRGNAGCPWVLDERNIGVRATIQS